MVLQTYERMHTKPGRMKSDASCGSRVGYRQAPHFSFISTFKIIMSIFLMVKTKNKKERSRKQLAGAGGHGV